jgi:hypothetical protein
MEDILSALRVFFLPPEYNMSSVTRFIRQVPVSTTYYNAVTILSATSTMVFELVPSAANIVGNYPPGYVKAAGAELQAALAEAVNLHTAANLVLRDMGKTIYAQYGTGAASDPSAYFRQVQLLRPSAITSAAQTFGVLGGQNIPDAYTDFLTFYIPVAVAGVKGPQVNTQAFAIAGGQM